MHKIKKMAEMMRTLELSVNIHMKKITVKKTMTIIIQYETFPVDSIENKNRRKIMKIKMP